MQSQLAHRIFSALCGRHRSRSKSLPRQPKQDDGDIVIIGAGVIGLCTAYHLAKQRQGRDTVITVLDARDDVFSAASSHNTGCLHYDFHDSFGQDLTELGKYSFDIWQSIAANPDGGKRFVATTGYRAQSFFPIRPGSENDEAFVPGWVDMQKDWAVDWGSKGSTSATVNSEKVGFWLKNECRRLDVRIVTSAQVIGAKLTDGVVESITYEMSGSTKTKDTRTLLCRKLVIAAGPWTPSLVKTLFPGSDVALNGSTNAGDWILFENPNPIHKKTTAAVFFDDIVHEKLEFCGRNDGSIWVCGPRNFTASLPPPDEDATPSDDLIEKLTQYSHRFIHHERGSAGAASDEKDSLRILRQGRAFRPFTSSGLPIISEAPATQLSLSGALARNSGVFICYGHGSYGMSLGMGSGKLMAQLMDGEKPDIDISKFTLV